MTHISSPRAQTRGAAPSRALFDTPLLGDRSHLTTSLAARRASVAELEAAWVAAAEADIVRHLGGNVRIDDRSTWDNATWLRYLAAAEQQEPAFKPRIKRLLTEIGNLEKLLAMPAIATSAPDPLAGGSACRQCKL